MKLTLIIPASDKDIKTKFSVFSEIQSFYKKIPVHIDALVISKAIPELPSATLNVKFHWISSTHFSKSKKIVQGLKSAMDLKNDVCVYLSMDLSTPLAEHLNVIKFFGDHQNIQILLGTRRDAKKPPHGEISFKQKLLQDIITDQWKLFWNSTQEEKIADPSHSFFAIKYDWLQKGLSELASLKNPSWFFNQDLLRINKKLNNENVFTKDVGWLTVHHHYNAHSQAEFWSEMIKILFPSQG